MIHIILVPTDGSEHADKAIDLASDIAAKYDARLIIFHTLMHHADKGDIRSLCTRRSVPDETVAKLDQFEDDIIAVARVGAFPVVPPLPADLLYEIGSHITDQAASVAKSKGVENVTIKIADGAAADSIIEEVETAGADMIVMGSRGLGKFAGVFMGSVSHKVSHLAPCTVVAVK